MYNRKKQQSESESERVTDEVVRLSRSCVVEGNRLSCFYVNSRAVESSVPLNLIPGSKVISV